MATHSPTTKPVRGCVKDSSRCPWKVSSGNRSPNPRPVSDRCALLRQLVTLSPASPWALKKSVQKVVSRPHSHANTCRRKPAQRLHGVAVAERHVPCNNQTSALNDSSTRASRKASFTQYVMSDAARCYRGKHTTSLPTNTNTIRTREHTPTCAVVQGRTTSSMDSNFSPDGRFIGESARATATPGVLSEGSVDASRCRRSSSVPSNDSPPTEAGDSAPTEVSGDRPLSLEMDEDTFTSLFSRV